MNWCIKTIKPLIYRYLVGGVMTPPYVYIS